jgi:hypothetical protein
MGRPIKDMFLEIAEEWEKRWKDEVGLYDFLNEYIEIDDGQKTYVIKKKRKRPEYL